MPLVIPLKTIETPQSLPVRLVRAVYTLRDLERFNHNKYCETIEIRLRLDAETRKAQTPRKGKN